MAAGCGSRAAPLNHAQFEKQVNDAGQNLTAQLQKVFSKIGAASNRKGLAAAASTVRQAADVIDGQADSLHELATPTDAATANGNLVDGLHLLAAALRGFATVAEKGDVPKVQAFVDEANSQAIPGEQQIQAAIDALKKSGYQVS
ncbi:MAG: hypothetical protein M3Q23_07015 [Actinomycetota bacterium]|nr:hypothetical protein [Actinomycetota bacterium]